jgi:hypothetical protein
MRRLIVVLALVGALFGAGPAWADDEDEGGGGGAAEPAEAPAAQAPEPDDSPAPAAEPAPQAGGDDDQAAPAAAAGGDADNDGTPDAQEAKPADADGDADNDGTPDAQEAKAPDPDGDTDNDGTPDAQEAGAGDMDGDGTPDSQEDSDGDGVSDAAEAAASADDDDDVPYNKFDLDGDGKSDAELQKEWNETFDGYSAKMDEDAIDAALDARPEDSELAPSISPEQFRKIVALIKKVVLDKMEKKMAKKSAEKMATFSLGIFCFSLLGFGLLAMPLFLQKKYPGKGALLFKYSGLAAVTFFFTVNLFGGVLFGMKTAQGALGSATNPSLAIASGTFDTLYDNADDYIVMGKELFVPTLMALEGNSEEQPAVLLIENGMKVVEDAKVFMSVAKMFKKLDVVFSVLPIILFCVTMLLFAIAIKPTLTEIIKLPMRAASGEAGVGKETTRNALRRVWGELLATLCTVGVLTLLTLVSAFILGKIVQPALDALLGYFSLAVNYLQFVEGASSGVVFLTLFGVILFLALNLATLILSMSFFLGKCQKIFQAKFNTGTPVATHKRFFKWGVPAVLFVQLFPLLFVFVAERALDKINASLLEGIKDADAVPWTKIMLAGPLFLVAAYALMFWGARGFKAIGFLFAYKVTPKAPRASAPSQPAEPV